MISEVEAVESGVVVVVVVAVGVEVVEQLAAVVAAAAAAAAAAPPSNFPSPVILRPNREGEGLESGIDVLLLLLLLCQREESWLVGWLGVLGVLLLLLLLLLSRLLQARMQASSTYI